MARSTSHLAHTTLGTTPAVLYASSGLTKITHAVFHNKGPSVSSVTLYYAAEGEDSTAAGAKLASRMLQYGQSWVPAELIGLTMAAGSRILANSNAANAVDANLSGDTFG